MSITSPKFNEHMTNLSPECWPLSGPSLPPRLQRQLHRGSTQIPCCCSFSSLKGKWGSLWCSLIFFLVCCLSSSRHRGDTFDYIVEVICIYFFLSLKYTCVLTYTLATWLWGGKGSPPLLLYLIWLIRPASLGPVQLYTVLTQAERFRSGQQKWAS